MSNEASAMALPLHAASSAATVIRSRDSALSRWAPRALSAMATAWFVVAFAGQWIFAAYVFGLYGRATLTGNSDGWNAVMKHGYVAGDTLGNLVVVLHVGFAFVVMAAGGVQLIPAVRRRWPVFHHWNGRAYLGAVALMCMGGVVMVSTRAEQSSTLLAAQVINALVAAACIVQALRHAMARRIDLHRRWALRLYLTASAAWFFRIGLMFWLLVNHGPVGFDPRTFSGPFITFLAFAQYLLPLFVLELYLRAQRAGALMRWTTAAVLAVATLVTAGGIVGATMGLWLPRL